MCGHKVRKRRSAALLPGSWVLAVFLTPAPLGAQNQENQQEEATIVVTGTRIPRPDLTASSPVSTVNAEELVLTGTVNVEEVVRELPQALPGFTPGTNNGNPGAATINLRGMEEQRTLVLIDGKRFVPYNFKGLVDVNNIPAPLIERIDVVTGGASAVYGSDAMAGVVNFILRQDFTGLQLDANYRQTSENDGETHDVSVLMGGNFADGRGNAVIYAGWTDREPVSQGARPFSAFALSTDDGSRGGSATDVNGNVICSPACFLPGVSDPQDFVSFQPNGDLAPLTGLFNFNPFNLLQVPEERVQGTALIHFDVDNEVEAYGRLTFAQTEIDTVIAPSGTFFSEFDIPLNHSGLSAQARGVLSDRIINATANDPNGPTPGSDGLPDPQYDTNNDGVIDDGAVATAAFGRRTIEVGPRITRNRTVAYQAVAGLRGPLGASWNWDASYQYGRTELSRIFQNDINSGRVQAVIDGCPPGSPNGCAAGNLFGAGNLDQAAADFIALQVNENLYSNQAVFSFATNGDLGETFKVRGADRIGAAFGVEYRKEESETFPDDCYSTPDCSVGFGSVTAVDNEYDVKEVFAELLIPLLEGRPFAHRLTFETGVRYADYSTVGSVTSYKGGGEWAPRSRTLRLRAMYQKAVRAPTIFEFGSPREPDIGDADGDPCAGGASRTVNADLRALCLATGVPASSINAATGVSSVPNVIAGQLNIFEGGNPDLVEEDSDTITVGLVWSPENLLSGFNAQVDWYSIKIDNAITTIPENDILAGCYDPALNPARDPNSSFCQFVLRNPLTGGLVGNPNFGLEKLNQNIALLETEGVDVQLDYTLGTETLGRFAFTLVGTYVLANDKKNSQISPVNHCVGKYGNVCESPDPRLRFNQRTTWYVGDFTLGYRWRFLKGTRFDNPSAALPAFRTIGDYHYLDLVFGWKPQRIAGLSLLVGIDNAFDKGPPVVGQEAGPTEFNSGNTFPGTYDVLGRTYFANLTLKF